MIGKTHRQNTELRIQRSEFTHQTRLVPPSLHWHQYISSGIRRRAIFLCFLLLFLQTSNAQDRLLPVFHFNRLTTADGLPTNEIRSNVVRDRQGFIWVGTENGLARYDGYTCKVYRSFSNPNNALVLHVDTKGRLWIGTYGSGLSLYDPMNDRFVDFLPRQDDTSWLNAGHIVSIHEDESGTIWLSGNPQLVRLDLGQAKETANADSVAQHVRFHPISHEGFRDGVPKVDKWDDSSILVGTAAGLFTVNRRTCGVTRPGIPTVPGLDLDTVVIMSLFWENPQRLWIGTLLHGLYLFDRASGTLTGYHKKPWNGSQTRDETIQDLQLDGSGRLWIATGDGVDLFDPVSGKYYDYVPFDRAPGKSFWTRLSVDSTGTLWIGTGDDGLYFLPTRSFRFPRYALRGSSGGPREMETIDHWSDGSYWIGTEGELVRVQMENLQVTETVDLFKGEKSRYGRAGVWASYCDGKGRLWYGAWGLGLYRYEPQTGRVTNFRFSTQLTNLVPGEDVCRSILGVGGDSLWIAAYNDVLLTFDTRGNIFSKIPDIPNGSIVHLMKDRAGKIWISDEFLGLYVRDPATMTSTHFEHNRNDTTSISRSHPQRTYQDPQGRIWVGCDMLNLWEPETRSFKRFPNDIFADATFAYPLGTDARGRLWVRYSGRGLGVLDPNTSQFINFDFSDGLADPFEMALREDGHVILVGRGGMNIIHPDSLVGPQLPPRLVITRVLINDTVNLPLQNISAGTGLRLLYDENVLEFGFAAIDPGATHLIDYSYRLEGLENTWVHPNERRSVRYPGLSPGDYLFRFKAVNKFGRWSDQEIALAITIAPPWWRTTWAYAAYGLLVVGILLGGYRLRLRQIQLKQEAEMEHFQAEHLAEVDRLKSRFFSNISHEFRTPLTLILGPADQVIEDTEEGSTRQRLRIIKENAGKLFGLVNQLLDFSRLESGMMRLQVSSGDIVRFLRRVVMSFESWAERKHMSLEFRSDAQAIPGYFDADKLEKIINNLTSNALKFTAEGGRVSVEVVCKGGSRSAPTENVRLEITVRDTGPGISAEHLPHIFDRFYRVDETHTAEGTGVGLALTKELVDLHHGTVTVESTPGKGSVFTVTFPIEHSAYAPSEIAESVPQIERREHAEAEASSEVKRPVPTTAPADGKPIVLIVEDNADLRAYIREYLEVDYAVQEAGNGKEGYDRATEIVPDLVISDIMMPGMDGTELCRALKQDVRTSHVPVILLTARADTESKIEGLEIGADDYVTKPFDSKELVARVRNFIEQRRQLRRKFSEGVALKPGEVAVSSLDDTLLKKVMASVEKNIADENFGVEELAREVCLSRAHLNRKLHALTDLSPAELIRRMRLERGMQLLEKNAGSIAEIAYQVGFGSPSHFSASFRERFGILPSEVDRHRG